MILVKYFATLFKVNNRNSRKGCEIFSKFAIKTPEQHYWYCNGVFAVNFEQISLFISVSIVVLAQVHVCWE